MEIRHSAIAIVPCLDLDQSQAFYEQLGFNATSVYASHGYCILHDASGASIHLTRIGPGAVDPEQNAHGIYLYSENVDDLAASFDCRAEVRPWGLREFAVTDPDGTLVRVGWPA